MEKYIEHHLNGSVVLIPVLPNAGLKVEFIPKSTNENEGEVNAMVGSLSFLLHGDVKREESNELIRAFVSKYKDAAKDSEYYSTTLVVIVCLFALIIVLVFSNYESQPDFDINEFVVDQQQVKEFSPSKQMVDELLEIPDNKVMDIQQAKEQYLLALEQMSAMSKSEREEFLKTPKMQELMNTSWVNHIQGE